MCGIVSYTGHSQAAPILLDGLSKLEYRGYDSAGLAVRDGVNATKIVKAKGRLKALLEKTDHGHALACIFRKNCASVPEERSAIPLQTEQSSAG